MSNIFSELWEKVVWRIHTESGWDLAEHFKSRASQLLPPVVSKNLHAIWSFITSTPKLIITHPEIEWLQQQCLSSVMRLIQENESMWMDSWCLRSYQLLADWVLFRDIWDLTVEEALKLSNLMHRKNLESSSFQTQVTIKKWTRPVGTFPYWKNWVTREDALREVLIERDHFLSCKEEEWAKKEARSPNLKLARNLTKKGILVEYGWWKFKIKDLTIRASQKAWTLRDLYLENKNLNLQTQRSLNKHTFKEAYELMVEYIRHKLWLTEAEVNELKKYWNQFIYTQKTSR